jgi:hypothetical protein
MSLLVAPIQSELLCNSVLITGAPRSGTTLLGKLVGSLARLEYQFEPTSLHMIASVYAAGGISQILAKQLLTVYLAEDLFLESVHGRRANLRPHDDSQVLYRMHWADLNDRWQQVGNRADAIAFAQTHGLRLAMKTPHLFGSLDLMRSVMTGLKIVISVRNGCDVVRSIIRKGWVSDRGLERELWPYVSRVTGVNLPYWVPVAYHDRWPTMSPASRACLMWACNAERGLAERNSPDLYEVRYEQLLAEPWPVVEVLAAQLGHETTLHTRRWVDSIRSSGSHDSTDGRDFAQETDSDILTWFDRVNALWGY